MRFVEWLKEALEHLGLQFGRWAQQHGTNTIQCLQVAAFINGVILFLGVFIARTGFGPAITLGQFLISGAGMVAAGFWFYGWSRIWVLSKAIVKGNEAVSKGVEIGSKPMPGEPIVLGALWGEAEHNRLMQFLMSILAGITGVSIYSAVIPVYVDLSRFFTVISIFFFLAFVSYRPMAEGARGIPKIAIRLAVLALLIISVSFFFPDASREFFGYLRAKDTNGQAELQRQSTLANANAQAKRDAMPEEAGVLARLSTKRAKLLSTLDPDNQSQLGELKKLNRQIADVKAGKLLEAEPELPWYWKVAGWFDFKPPEAQQPTSQTTQQAPGPQPQQFSQITVPVGPVPAAALPYIQKAAKDNGVDPQFIAGIFMRESGGNLNTKYGLGGLCPMQVSPDTARLHGVDPQVLLNDLGVCFDTGAKEFARLLARFKGDVYLALLGYNAGQGVADKYVGIPWAQVNPNDLRGVKNGVKYDAHAYVNWVTGYLAGGSSAPTSVTLWAAAPQPATPATALAATTPSGEERMVPFFLINTREKNGISLYKIKSEGEKFYFTVPPGERYRQFSYPSSRWVVRDSQGNPVRTIEKVTDGQEIPIS